ncbi:hypothetical protein HanPSC8_Chr16g0716421 [Helianthus annuus]|nr:hypothetical protein HanLR1_Chr16g0620061 [Helianthus annuus]KAJ0821130.1 hypothetical protein HanPSC8_Chr16g0716421 [Helianthus annuus]
MIFDSPNDAMPWVGLYIAVASVICILAMTADVVQAFWQWKLWFPNRFFTLNAATITLVAIAMKPVVDLPNEVPDYKANNLKVLSMNFLITMLGNLLPSLGLLDGRELLMNMVALGILIITIFVNFVIQFDISYLVDTFLWIFFTLWPFSVAVTVSATRKKLEHLYKESQSLVSCHQEKMFSYKEHKCLVKKYWMMTETHNLQFVIACSPISSAFGVLCSVFGLRGVFQIYFLCAGDITFIDCVISDYKWSSDIIVWAQTIGIVLGGIAPTFRCFTSIGHYNLSKKWSKNQLNVFRVEKHWIETLQQWKRSHVHSHIPGHHCKIVFYYVKNTILNIWITIHIGVLIICKTICLIPRTFLIMLSCCWHFFKSFLKRFRNVANASSNNMSLGIEEYARYVVQIEEDAKLSNRILRNTLHSITKLLVKSEKKEPLNLVKLLEKSTGFDGVVKFDNDQVPPLYPEETNNCWSLVVVTLTSIAIALPNIANGHFKRLLVSVREGLQIIRHVEECLNVDEDLEKARKAAKHAWVEVEMYRSWLQIELQKLAQKGKSSKEILNWLGDEAAKIVIQFKSLKRPSIDHSPYKFILASSMYRISQSILLECNEQENLSRSDEELFEWISTMIADILSACFTNLPHVINMKCHHRAIEKREDNIRNAAQLLGKSKKILKILKASQLPNIDLDSMAYVDKWHELTISQLPNAGQPNGVNTSASTTMIERDSSSSVESFTISFM